MEGEVTGKVAEGEAKEVTRTLDCERNHVKSPSAQVRDCDMASSALSLVDGGHEELRATASVCPE
jgi:hypothetical protein